MDAPKSLTDAQLRKLLDNLSPAQAAALERLEFAAGKWVHSNARSDASSYRWFVTCAIALAEAIKVQ